MKKKVMTILGIAKPELPFNHVIRAGRFLFLASQLSSDLKTREIKIGTILEQTRQALDNIKFLLEGCGATMDDIVKTVIYMRDLQDFDKVNEVYCEYFTKGNEPARVAMQAISPLKNIDIEIEVVAYK